MLCSMVQKKGNTVMVDFDLDTPIKKILTDMLDKVEGHVGDCDCVNCNSLEVLAYMIKVD
jgi:hypothetical protein